MSSEVWGSTPQRNFGEPAAANTLYSYDQRRPLCPMPVGGRLRPPVGGRLRPPIHSRVFLAALFVGVKTGVYIDIVGTDPA